MNLRHTRVTIAISTVGVKLSSLVALGNVNLGEVTLSGDLDVVRSFHEVDT